MDVLSSERRSALMGRIGHRDTGPERAVRRLLHKMGFRFRLHRTDLPGKPDIVLSKWRVIIFVHGCFWHGCTMCDKGLRRPKTNAAFWEDKIHSNIVRDRRVETELTDAGWKVVCVWECELKKMTELENKLRSEIVSGSIDAVR